MMSRRASLFLLVVPIFVLSCVVLQAQTDGVDAIALGRGVFELHCGGCHGGARVYSSFGWPYRIRSRLPAAATEGQYFVRKHEILEKLSELFGYGPSSS